MPEVKTLAKKLKQLRTEFHESQITFAANCGISKETLSLIECEKGDPRLSTLQKVAAYTNHTVSELLLVKENESK